MAAAANWANLPLPPGWQAVWDQTQNRYFFIDHSTKTTSWIDPREALWKQQNMPVQSSAQYSGYTQHAGRAQPVAQAHEMIPMADRQTHKQHWTHDLTPGTGSSRHSSREDVAIEETMFVQDNSETNRHLPPGDVAGSRRSSSSGHKLTLMKLRADFPDTEGELISDLLESNHGNERETRTVLMELGYKHHTATPSCTQSPRRGSATKTMSPSRVQSVPAPVQLATWEKNNMKRKLQQEFQSVSQTVVEMALEVSMYDEAKARAVLHSQSRQSASTGGDANNMASQSRRSSTQQVDRRDVSHSRSATPSYGSATPLYGSGLIETSVHISESTHSRSPTPVGAPSSSNSGSVTPRGASTTPQVVSPSRYTKRSTPKVSVTTSRPAPKSTVTTSRPAPKSSVTTSRPAPKSSVTTSRLERTEIRKKSPAIKKQPDYVSPNRTLAKGPDASLVIGPQIQNLMPNYIMTQGADASLMQGPHPDNHKGPVVTAVGSNVDLARGPQWQRPEMSCGQEIVQRNTCERVFEMLCLRRETAL